MVWVGRWVGMIGAKPCDRLNGDATAAEAAGAFG
jgi:hypothetical protein